jgi:hypothetical protein
MAGYAVTKLWWKNRWLTAALCLVCWLSGGIEAARLIHPQAETHRLYTKQEIELADWVRANTEPNSVWLTGTHHNNWLFNLTGRQVLMAYEGWLWSHGYEYAGVKKDLESLLKDPNQENLLNKYDVGYAAIGPLEVEDSGADFKKFEKNFTPILETVDVKLFKRKRPTNPANGPAVNP